MVEVSSTPPSERYPGRPPEGRLVVIASMPAAYRNDRDGVQFTGVEILLS